MWGSWGSAYRVASGPIRDAQPTSTALHPGRRCFARRGAVTAEPAGTELPAGGTHPATAWRAASEAGVARWPAAPAQAAAAAQGEEEQTARRAGAAARPPTRSPALGPRAAFRHSTSRRCPWAGAPTTLDDLSMAWLF